MLTVRHYEPSGHESIRQTKTLYVEPAEKSVDGKMTVWIDGGEVGPTECDFGFSSGTVYVMNDSGKTVAVYHLAWPEPTK